jgi:hypothetical protein
MNLKVFFFCNIRKNLLLDPVLNHLNPVIRFFFSVLYYSAMNNIPTKFSDPNFLYNIKERSLLSLWGT